MMAGWERHYVYIMGREEGPVKVGISVRPWDRLSSIRTSCPFPAKLLYCRPMESREHALHHERNFHVVNAGKRTNGEWFDTDLELAIESIESALEAEEYFRRERGEIA